jgi:hypothetical protein
MRKKARPAGVPRLSTESLIGRNLVDVGLEALDEFDDAFRHDPTMKRCGPPEIRY